MRFNKRILKSAAPWAAGGFAGLFLAGNLGAAIYIEQLLVNPRRKKNKTSDLSNFIPEVNYRMEECEFRSDDNYRISAMLMYPEKQNGQMILVCHGIAHDKRSGVPFVQYLIQAGYTLMLIDFRNHGDSDGRITTYGYHEKHDLIGAIRYLRNRGMNGKIGVLGASMGAAIALQAAAETAEIQGMVLDSPFASLEKISLERAIQITHLPKYFLYFPLYLAYFWTRAVEDFNVAQVSPVDSAKKLQCPILLIHGSRDERIGAHHSKEIYENARVPRELWLVEGAGHLGAFAAHPDEYKRKVLQFFEQHLLS